MKRRTAAAAVGASLFLLGLPASLAYGVLGRVRGHERGILETMDFFVSNFVLPLAGLLVALFAGWAWSARQAMRESDLGDGWLGRAWLFSLRFVAPLVITIVAIVGILGD